MTPTAVTSNTESVFVFNRRWRKRAAIVAAAWFFGCVLYTAPAVLFETLLRKFVPQLQLRNVSGSFWNGRAAQAFWLAGAQRDQVIALGGFEWHLQPWSLLWLHPSARVSTSYGEQFIDTKLRVSPLGGVTLLQTHASLPAALLSNWAPVKTRGQFALKLQRAELSRVKSARTQLDALQGTLYWQQAQWQWNTRWLTLGDYRCELSLPAAQQIRCALQGQGALALDGVIDANMRERNWAVQLQVKMEPALPEDFRQGLQVLLAAQPGAQGGYSIKREGRW